MQLNLDWKLWQLPLQVRTLCLFNVCSVYFLVANKEWVEVEGGIQHQALKISFRKIILLWSSLRSASFSGNHFRNYPWMIKILFRQSSGEKNAIESHFSSTDSNLLFKIKSSIVDNIIAGHFFHEEDERNSIFKTCAMKLFKVQYDFS